MPTRRRLVQIALGTTALAGCGLAGGALRPGPPAPLPGLGIDAHLHLFNATDVPVMGWLDQVDFTTEGGGSLPDATRSPLIRLIVAFMANGTRDAGEELARLPANLARASDREMREDGVARLADFLADYEAERLAVPPPGARMRALPAAELTRRAEDQQLFADLAAAAGLDRAEILAEPLPADGAAPASRRTAAAPPPPVVAEDPARSARAIAEGLFDPRNQAGDPVKETLSGMIRWAELMTRDRARILQQAASLYGRPGEVQVFCNHLLDLSWWLKGNEIKQSDPDDLIRLFAALSARRSDVLVLNFAGFCPLRAAIEGEVAHARLRRAIDEHGFAGVKLYPPMGFRPLGNGDVGFGHARRAPPGGGAALDRELRRLYGWCLDNDLPVAAHASASMGAGPGTAAYSAPWLWRPVLREFPGLRVNLAHFGGFGGHGLPEWEGQLSAMLGEFPSLYFDTGFWTETLQGAAARPGSLATTRRLLASTPGAAQRMLYGSDWSMIARLPGHPAYLAGIQRFLADLPVAPAQAQAVMGDNARRWLGLDREGPQSRRLARFYGGHPVWRRLFPAPGGG
ncbi:amidohydrolase family protein [Paracoccus spongiarum]|uniref:Amidohydrolase family protein n=1 Tax=Paracoccus spongiarum TaxID=3064387 RepID=A0ABT9JCB0_9RHOB|nr:amidohydrolase family protein [Paracoccus sp. 2205BS29-5]MDP5307245.1 amidohydrolase family protein [Paracoccus sp. 2205BS29-5]